MVVSSLTGLTGVPTRTAYAASKHALQGFYDSLRIELRYPTDTGVSVTLACPDFVLSEMHRRALGPDGRPLGVSPMQEARIMTAVKYRGLDIAMIGSPQTGWLNTLNASSLNCRTRLPPKLMFRMTDISVVNTPGPMTMLRPAFP